MSPRLSPVSRHDLIRRLRAPGFEGPLSGGNHQMMARGSHTVRVPSPHSSDVGVELLARTLRQAGITAAEWERG